MKGPGDMYSQAEIFSVRHREQGTSCPSPEAYQVETHAIHALLQLSGSAMFRQT